MTPGGLGVRLGLPRAGELLDAGRLSEALGRPVALQRVRVKPGRSLLVSWVDADASAEPGHGWAMLVTDPDKVAGLLRRAARATGAVRRHDDGLFSGDPTTDPRLATPVRHALGLGPLADAGRVLRYNPGRRLILAVEDASGPAVLRIAERPLTGLVELSRRWADAGVPTLPHRWWGAHPTAAATDRWGSTDLATGPDPDAARATGEALARLHALPLEVAFGATSPNGRGADAPEGSGAVLSAVPAIPPGADALTRLLPGLAPSVAVLRAALSALPEAPVAPCHGDMSPDQVLTGGDGVRIIDLDRAGPGHPGLDLGTWLAWCRLNESPDLAEAFLAGYRSVAPLPEVRPGLARALLACAIDPFRQANPAWPAEVQARVRAALASLTDSSLEMS